MTKPRMILESEFNIARNQENERAFFSKKLQKFLKHMTYLNIPIMTMQAPFGKRQTEGQRSIWQVPGTVLGTKILEQNM